MPCRCAPCEVCANCTSASCRSCKSRGVGTDLSEVERGSLLKFISSILKSPFPHYGVYIGDNLVVHLVKYGECCSCQEGEEMTNVAGQRSTCEKCNLPYYASKAEIKAQNINDMRGNAKTIKYNSHRVNNAPFTPEEIEKRARSMIGPANFRWRDLNCEHFATWCRYGEPVSSQGFHYWKSPAEYEEKLKKGVVVKRGVPVQDDSDTEWVHTNSVQLSVQV